MCVDSRRFHVDLLKKHRQIIADELTRRREVITVERQRQEEQQKQSDWRNHPEVIWIIGGVAAVPLVMLLGWQVRLLIKRWTGHCPTGD
jgi:hypothetical protein